MRSIYVDFRRSGRIDICEHERKSLRMALRSIDEEFDRDNPDFRDVLKAAIEDYDAEACAEEEAEEEAPDPTPTPSATAAPAPTAAPYVPPAADDSGTPELDFGDDGDSGGDDSGGGAIPPRDGGQDPPPDESQIAPVQPEPTPSPVATPAPPPAEAQLVVTRPGDDPSLLVPALLLALALLGLARRRGHRPARAQRRPLRPLARRLP